MIGKQARRSKLQARVQNDRSVSGAGCFPLVNSLRSGIRLRGDHLRRPAFDECSEAVECLGEIVSGSREAQAKMRGCIEAIARSQQDSMLGGGLAERTIIFSAQQPGKRSHPTL